MQKLKRDRGDTFNAILPNLVCVIVVMVLVTLFTSWIANVEHRENLNHICRKYILQMESTGYLSRDMQADLLAELKNAGMTEVNIVAPTQVETTSTTNQVDFGEDVYLMVKGKMRTFDFDATRAQGKFMAIIAGESKWDVTIYKTSISKAKKVNIVPDDSLYIYLTNDSNKGKVLYNGTSSQAIRKTKLQKGESQSFLITANDGYYLDPSQFQYGSRSSYSNVTFPTIVEVEGNASSTYDSATNTITVYKDGPKDQTYIFGLNTVGDGLQSVSVSGKNFTSCVFAVKQITEDKVLFTGYKVRDDIVYTVNHYKREINGIGIGKPVETETFTGSYGDVVSPSVKTYKGFVSPEPVSIKLGLEDNVVDYVYERNKYSFKIELPENEMLKEALSTNGSSVNAAYSYGEEIKISLSINDNYINAVKFDNPPFTIDWSNPEYVSGIKNENGVITATFKMPAQNVTVTPKIKTSNYKIIYNSNGGTGSISSKTVGYFDKVKLSNGEGISKQYFEFLGWSTTKDAQSPDYMPGDEVSALTTSDSITLYAVWKDLGKTSFKVVYHVQQTNGDFIEKGSKVISDNIFTSTEITEEMVKDDKYLKSGIIEYGYTKLDNNTVSTFYPKADGSTEVHVYYIMKQYTLTVVTTEHSQINATNGFTKTCTYGEEINLSATFDNGYMLKEFKVDSKEDMTVTQNTNDSTIKFNMPASDVTVYVYHKCVTYNIKYDLDGGDWPEGYIPPVTFDIETSTFTIENPVRDHYTFVGWTTDEISTPQLSYSIAQGTTGDINLYAQWIAEIMKIKVKCESADKGKVYINNEELSFTNGYAEYQLQYNDEYTIRFEPNEKTSIVSLSKTNDNGTTQLIVDPIQDEKTFSETLKFETTYNVEFKDLTYTITYHSGIDEKDNVVQTVTFNTKDEIYSIDKVNELSGNKFVKEGYEFKGWLLKETDDPKPERVVAYQAGDVIENLVEHNNDNYDLYAAWKDVVPPTYTIKVSNDYSDNKEYQTITVNATDNESGVAGYYYSDHKLNESELETLAFLQNQNTYDVYDSGSVYVYISDFAGNVYTDGKEYVFYKTTLNKDDKTIQHSSSQHYLITLKGNSFTFPVAERVYSTYLGWSTVDPTEDEIGIIPENAINTAIKTLTPTGDTEYYPVLQKTEATLVTGVYVNTALKQLINATSNYESIDNTITGIEFTTTPPSKSDKYFDLAYDRTQMAPVKAYRSGSKIKIYTSATTINWNDDSSYMFANLRKCVNNDLLSSSIIKTNKAIDLEGLFEYYGYSDLTKLDLSNLDTSRANNMRRMFYATGYKNMTTITFGNKFNTSNVTNMETMFANCGYNSLKSLSLGNNFDTSSVVTMESMFADCGYDALTSIDFGNKFSTKSAINISFMFSHFGYSKLQSFTLPSGFTNESLQQGHCAFEYMGHDSMTLLDLSNFGGPFVGDCIGTADCQGYEYLISNAGMEYNCVIIFPSQDMINNLTYYRWNTSRIENLDMNKWYIKDLSHPAEVTPDMEHEPKEDE